MYLLLTGKAGTYVQLITVLLIFVLVLGITAAVTKWMANYQKQQGSGNIQVIETGRISNNQYIQIVRVGSTYMVIAVSKDTVTMLGEVPEESLRLDCHAQNISFRDILDKTLGRNVSSAGEPKEDREHDEH